jgi:enamine deaminase RidA (YjgF/YER057c/UK114 family)
MERQARYIYGQMADTLEKLGSNVRQVMKINSYHVHGHETDMHLRTRREFFGDAEPPPSTLVRMAESPVPGATLVLDVTALATDAARPREVFMQPKARPGSDYKPVPFQSIFRAPIFSQAARGGGFVFSVGVGGRELSEDAPETVPRPDEITHDHPYPLPQPKLPYHTNRARIQMEWILTGLQGILEAAGTSFEHVVRGEIHLSDIRYLATLNKVWERFFPKDPLARPDVMLVEIELVALDPSGPYRKETISTGEAPTPLGPEPQAVKAGPYVFLSTQLATDWRQGVPPEARPDPNFPFHASAIARQVEYIFRNVDAICRAAGTSAGNLLRRRAVHTDLGELAEAEEVWAEKLGDRMPPTTTFRVPGPLAVPACTVQYDLIAGIVS